jgi:hypothetical protein
MTMRARLFVHFTQAPITSAPVLCRPSGWQRIFRRVFKQQVQNNIFNAAYLQTKQQRDMPHGRYPSAVKSFDLCRQDGVLK